MSLIHEIKAAIDSFDPNNPDNHELHQHIAHHLYSKGYSQKPAVEIVAQTVDRTTIIAENSETLEEFKAKVEDRFAHLRKSKDSPSKS